MSKGSQYIVKIGQMFVTSCKSTYDSKDYSTHGQHYELTFSEIEAHVFSHYTAKKIADLFGQKHEDVIIKCESWEQHKANLLKCPTRDQSIPSYTQEYDLPKSDAIPSEVVINPTQDFTTIDYSNYHPIVPDQPSLFEAHPIVPEPPKSLFEEHPLVANPMSVRNDDTSGINPDKNKPEITSGYIPNPSQITIHGMETIGQGVVIPEEF